MSSNLMEINKMAAGKASEAMSKLIGNDVGVDVTSAAIRKVGDLSPVLASEEMVVGVYMLVTGDVKGASLLIFPQESAFKLSDVLVGREPGTTRSLTALDISALKEVGNIVAGNYFAVLSNLLQVKIVEHIPNFSSDMFGAIVEQIITDFARESEQALVVEIEFVFKPLTLKGYFLLLFRLEELKALLGENL